MHQCVMHQAANIKGWARVRVRVKVRVGVGVYWFSMVLVLLLMNRGLVRFQMRSLVIDGVP